MTEAGKAAAAQATEAADRLDPLQKVACARVQLWQCPAAASADEGRGHAL